MGKIEYLMSQFPNINFEFESMPHKFGGFSIDDQIIINSTLSVEHQFQWLSEEISHHEPSIVDISDYPPTINARQEAAARNWVYRQSLTYRQLEEIRHKHAENDYEIADDLGLQIDYLHQIGFSYGLYFKHIK